VGTVKGDELRWEEAMFTRERRDSGERGGVR